MPIKVGDAVLEFFGDSTQLELAFDKIGTEAEAKLVPAAAAGEAVGKSLEDAGVKGQVAGAQISGSWMKVAQATAENAAAQKALAQALDLVKKNGVEDAAAILALAAAQKLAARTSFEMSSATKEAGEQFANTFREGKAEIMSVNRELGLGVDRHLAGWISKLPGVGAALSAAFNVTMVLTIIKLLVDGLVKLSEWHEEAEKIRQAWVLIDSDFRETSIHIQEQIEHQEEAFIRLTKGPVAALDFALLHMRSTADQTLKAITTELDSLSSQMSNQKKFLDFDTGFTKAVKDVDKFKSTLIEAMHTAEDAHPEDRMAGYREGIRLTTVEYDKLNKALEDNKKIIEGTIPGEIISGKELEIVQRKFAAVSIVRKQLEQGVQLDNDREKAEAEQRARAAAQHELEVGNAQIIAAKAVSQARLALQAELDKVQFERGKISFEQYLQSQVDFENKSYTQNKLALEQKLKLLQEDGVKNAAAITETTGQIQALSLQHKATLLRIDQEGYAHQASAQEKAIQQAIAGTKQGTQERVDLEVSLGNFLLQTWGAQSNIYQEQLVRIAESRRAFGQEQKKLAEEQNKSDLALLADRRSATDQYYSYLQQTARINATTLRNLQNQEYVIEYQRKVQALVQTRDQLGPQEVLARKQINDQIALLDQQAQERREMFALQANDEILDSYKQLGIKSSEEQEREVQLAQVAYDKIEKSGVATYHDILEAKKKLLDLKISAALSAGDQEELNKTQKELKGVTNELDRLGLSLTKVNILSNNFFDAWHKQAPKTGALVKNMGEMAKQALDDMGKAEASAIQAFILGQDSLGHAMRKATAQILAEYAARAAVEAIYWLAYGFAMLASMQYDRASAAFTAAAMLGGFAVVAGGLASMINPKDKGASTSAGGSSATDNSATAGPAAPNPVQTINVQSFARGGLISGPTLAMIGDNVSRTSSGSREIAASLDDPEAMRAIGAALAPHLQQNSGPNIHVEVRGLISPDNLAKVVKQISQKVKGNQATLVSSNSFRVTKRSV